MRPHPSISLSSYCFICVLMLLCICPHPSMSLCSYCYVCVLMLLCMCPPMHIGVRHGIAGAATRLRGGAGVRVDQPRRPRLPTPDFRKSSVRMLLALLVQKYSIPHTRLPEELGTHFTGCTGTKLLALLVQEYSIPHI